MPPLVETEREAAAAALAVYNTTVRTLQARRVNQLNDLERKLNAGKPAITRIPAKS